MNNDEPQASKALATAGNNNFRHGKVVQVDPRLSPGLAAPGFLQRLKLEYDEPFSNSDAPFNLRRYNMAEGPVRSTIDKMGIMLNIETSLAGAYTCPLFSST